MKKFMFYLMVLNSFIASIVMIVTLALGDGALPTVVLALRGALVLGSVVLVVKKFVSWVRRSELSAFYIAEAAVAVFNLVYLSMFHPGDVPLFEFAITGTLITPVLNCVLIFLLRKTNRKYVTFEQVAEAVQAEDVPGEIGAVAVKQA